MVKRLHRAMLLPLCLSMLLSAVPAHASEAGRGNSAVEAAVTEGETVAEEGGEAAAIEETAEVTEFSAAGEAEEAAGAAEEAAVTGETAETATEVAAEAEPGSAGEAAEEAATRETAEVVAAGETAEAVTEVAAEVEPDSAGEAAETAATGETVEVAAAGETTEVAASAEAADTAVAVPEVTTVAEPALKSTAGAVEKIAQMKLEVIDYLDEGFGDSQMLSSAGSRLLIDTYSQGAWDVLNSWLNDKKYMDFDIYISHYHNDHMGNVVNILNDGKYKVNKLYLPDYSYMTGSNSYMQDYRSDCADLMNTAKNKGVQIVTLVKEQGTSRWRQNLICWTPGWIFPRISASSATTGEIPAIRMIFWRRSARSSTITITAGIRRPGFLLRTHGLTGRCTTRRSWEMWRVCAITGILRTAFMTM